MAETLWVAGALIYFVGVAIVASLVPDESPALAALIVSVLWPVVFPIEIMLGVISVRAERKEK